jgi:Holliday junction resolvase
MGKINSRAKGASAEREFIKELSEYLGDALLEPMKRNLEQTRKGGHDIVGLDGFAIEIKRYKRIKEGDIVKFWAQAVDQAKRVGAQPVLAYREDFCSWRVRIPWGFLMDEEWDEDVDFTIELSLKAFATLVRERLVLAALQSNATPHKIAA